MTASRPSIAIVVAPHGGLAHYVLHLWQALCRHATLRWVALVTEPVNEALPRHGVAVSAELDPADPASPRRAAQALRAAGVEIVNLQVATRLIARLDFHRRFLEECRRQGLRVVHTLHNVLPHSISRYDPAMLRAFYELADGYLVGNEREAERLHAAFPLGARPVAIAPMGPFTLLDERRYDRASARRELGPPDEAPVVLFFGSYRPEKGLEVLLEAFPRVQAARSDAWLVVSSNSRHCPESEPFLAALRERTAGCHGWKVDDSYVPDARIEPLFRAADVVALPYRHVTQSGVRALAAAFGRAVVLTDAFDDGAALDGVWGRCVRSDDPEALAAGLLDVLACSRRERDAWGAAGHERAQRRESWEQNAERVTALCRRILAS